ncbi:hypothetical protein BH766_gp69 [Gordonia phage Demosthenes]|uniref:Uncharacterized protein n=1 Tax=Gordonia phage Demosthenes TaxID=1838067 RepID=A0A160DE26_9CAUD|nr:hypothetical protein BH766_gp69 [Gordonia phage Demosthenes]ANA86038.1 hypothetical protein PBI_DEMOSTHENES_69 [Gordonia phage Demosthenes]
MNMLKKAGIACASVAAILAASAGTASAVSVDEYDDVKYVWCTDSGADVQIENTNAYGGTEDGTFRLSGRIGDGTRSCGWQTFNAGDDVSYVSTWITDEDGGYVYCAIYLDGVLVSQSEDRSSYYSVTGCY